MIFKAVMRSPSKWLLVSLGIGALLLSVPRMAQSQSISVDREAIQSLNLSRSQMRDIRSVMQGYQSELQNILTSDQMEQLQVLQTERQEQSTSDGPLDLTVELNLDEDQALQLETLQGEMAEELREILSAEQLEQAQEMGIPGL